ncbi:GntR family transcriptional regulator [Xaviernesmea oryzae]|uniref:GntR family transcriptional regulator n=1 Tax=Xaviernesmea oryzae TaxID=464029 RepID=A0A1Q9B1Y6_9HYPH|nr:GntR family transcriptional regulator [Xaviernesmea oryzae]OLP62013.1 GntR family transcriptional regulator [Xaviernesmea oryzae]SEK97105.1 DNA-binding transcriptional regulator, GntR family [Xaviernesmea oryzae]
MSTPDSASPALDVSRRAPPARRITSATQIFDMLRAEIVASHLPPGTPLQDKMLIERFGVSRTPVREALIRLAEIGLVDIFPQSGTFVSRVPVKAIPEAVLIRKALEGITVEKAAEQATPERMGPLEKTIRRQKVAAGLGDLDAFHEADEAFHAELSELAGHPGIWTLLTQVKMQIDRARRLTLPVLGRMEQVIAEHEIIRAAVAEGDAEAAKTAMMHHLNAVILDVDALKDRYPDYFI